jgi:hypothetical protein
MRKICDKQTEKTVKNIWIVAYDPVIRIATRSKDKAKKFYERKKREYPSLPWKLMNIQEYGDECYSQGSSDNY